MDRSRGGLAARLVAALPETRAEQEPHLVRAHHDSCSQHRLHMATQALFTASKAKAAATRQKRGCAQRASGPSALCRLNEVPSPWPQIAGDARGIIMPKDSMQASRDSLTVVLRKVVGVRFGRSSVVPAAFTPRSHVVQDSPGFRGRHERSSPFSVTGKITNTWHPTWVKIGRTWMLACKEG